MWSCSKSWKVKSSIDHKYCLSYLPPDRAWSHRATSILEVKKIIFLIVTAIWYYKWMSCVKMRCLCSKKCVLKASIFDWICSRLLFLVWLFCHMTIGIEVQISLIFSVLDQSEVVSTPCSKSVKPIWVHLENAYPMCSKNDSLALSLPLLI